MLVLHWVAGEQGHAINEFSNPSSGSYCDFTKERGKVRGNKFSIFSLQNLEATPVKESLPKLAIAKSRKSSPEETF